MARTGSGVTRGRRGRRGERPARAGAGVARKVSRAPARLPADLPERLQAVLEAAEAVITETRRVIRVVRRDLSRQHAATRLVLTGQPVSRRSRRGRRPRR